MSKLNILKSDIPQKYIEACIIGGMSQAKFASMIGIGASRLSQILKEPEIKKAIEDLQLKTTENPGLLDTKGKVDIIYEALYNRFEHAKSTNDNAMLLKLAHPLIEALRIRGLLDKVVPSSNTNIQINNLTQTQKVELIQGSLKGIGSIISKFVPLERQQDAIKEVDGWLTRITLEESN